MESGCVGVASGSGAGVDLAVRWMWLLLRQVADAFLYGHREAAEAFTE